MDTPVCRLVLIRSSLALVAWLNFGGVIRFAGTWRLIWSQTIPQAEVTLNHCNFMLIERYLSQCSRQQFQISLSHTHTLIASSFLSLTISSSLSPSLSPLSIPPSFRLCFSLRNPSNTIQHQSMLILCVGLCGCVTLSQPFVNTLQRIYGVVLKDHTQDCEALFPISSYLFVSLYISSGCHLIQSIFSCFPDRVQKCILNLTWL